MHHWCVSAVYNQVHLLDAVRELLVKRGEPQVLLVFRVENQISIVQYGAERVEMRQRQ